MSFVDRLRHMLSPNKNVASTREQTLQDGFFQAVMNGDIFFVRMLLTSEHRQAAVRWADAAGRSGLFWAVRMGNATMTNLLLLHGADPNQRDASGRNAHAVAGLHGWRLHPYGLAEAQARPSRAQAQQHEAPPTEPSPPVPTLPGTYALTGDGHLRSSSTGVAVSFADQKQAGLWIIGPGAKSLSQVFEVANHPTRQGAFTVKDRNFQAQPGRK